MRTTIRRSVWANSIVAADGGCDRIDASQRVRSLPKHSAFNPWNRPETVRLATGSTSAQLPEPALSMTAVRVQTE